MSIYEILLLAYVLSIDAFLVSFSYGLCTIDTKKKYSLILAFGTGFSQFFMPVIGAILTSIVYFAIKDYASYLAGVIFVILGIKLYIDAKVDGNEDEGAKFLTPRLVFIASLATSIDALAAGSSLYLLKVNVLFASSIIGVITFINSLIGFKLGEKIKNKAPEFFGKIGGLILILIGIKSIVL